MIKLTILLFRQLLLWRACWPRLVLAVGCLTAGGAWGQSYYVNVQPIVVCDTPFAGTLTGSISGTTLSGVTLISQTGGGPSIIGALLSGGSILKQTYVAGQNADGTYALQVLQNVGSSSSQVAITSNGAATGLNGYIVGNLLFTSGIGSLTAGQSISGTGILSGTSVTSSGAAAGSYVVNVGQTFSGSMNLGTTLSGYLSLGSTYVASGTSLVAIPTILLTVTAAPSNGASLHIGDRLIGSGIINSNSTYPSHINGPALNSSGAVVSNQYTVSVGQSVGSSSTPVSMSTTQGKTTYSFTAYISGTLLKVVSGTLPTAGFTSSSPTYITGSGVQPNTFVSSYNSTTGLYTVNVGYSIFPGSSRSPISITDPNTVTQSAGSSCAAYNNLAAGTASGPIPSITNPIGYWNTTVGDPNYGRDVTQHIWNQAGIQIAWAPMVYYNNAVWQTIRDITPISNGNETSNQLLELTQQPLVSQPFPFTASSPYNPTPPLNASPHTLNMFFVTKLQAPPSEPGGVIYGLSLIGSNGIAISQSTFPIAANLNTESRFDTLAHEIGHSVGLNHSDKYNPNAPTKDLMTAGCCAAGTNNDLRTEPSSADTAVPSNNNGGVFYDLANSIADVINNAADVLLSPWLGSSSSTNQQCAVGSTTGCVTGGFVQQVAQASTTITDPPGSNLVTFATNGPSYTVSTTRPPVKLKGLTVTLYPGVQFDPAHPISFTCAATGTTPACTGSQYVSGYAYYTGTANNPACPHANTQCLVVTLGNNGGLPAGTNDLVFTQGILRSPTAPPGQTLIQLMANDPATLSYSFSDGLTSASQVATTSTTTGSTSSQSPSPTTPPQTQPATFQSFVQNWSTTSNPPPAPCNTQTQTSGATLSNGCPDPTKTSIADSDPAREGGQVGKTNSCVPSAALSAQLQGANVTAYVPNGAWQTSPANTGIQLVPLEGAGPNPVSFPTGADVINSCAANSLTGQTICTANNQHVYVLNGTALASLPNSLPNPLVSGATGTAQFSGGFCQNCSIALNQFNNQAVITMGLQADNGTNQPNATGVQFLDLGTYNFSAPVSLNQHVAEAVLWDPFSSIILSPNEFGVYDLLDVSALPSSLTSNQSVSVKEYTNQVGPMTGTPQMLAGVEDCKTAVAMASEEFTSNVFLADLTQATKTSGTPTGAWTAGSAQTSVSLPEFSGFSSGVSALAVAPGTHLAIATGQFGGNQFGVLLMPASSGSGTPNFQDYVVASLPNTPDGATWQEGLDPQPLMAYVSPNNARAYAVMANAAPPTYLALIDMAGLLAAPRSAAHVIDPSYDLLGNGVVRYVATQCGVPGAPC